MFIFALNFSANEIVNYSQGPSHAFILFWL